MTIAKSILLNVVFLCIFWSADAFPKEAFSFQWWVFYIAAGVFNGILLGSIEDVKNRQATARQ